MSIILKSGSSGYLADVTADRCLQIAAPGGVKILDQNSNPFIATENGGLSVSMETLVFAEQVDGSNIDIRKWNQSVSGMTIAQANGFQALNSGAAKTTGAYAILSSIKNLPMYGTLPLKVSINALIPIAPESNATIEWGIGSVATNAAPTDGAFFRYSPAGTFLAVISNGGVETVSPALTLPGTTEVEIYDIVLVEDLVLFYIGDEIVATVPVPPGQAFPTNSGRLPLFARVYNGGSAPAAAPTISIGQWLAVRQGVNEGKPWSNVIISQGGGASRAPISPFAQSSNCTNSTNPTSASLSNTAAGYTTLGGRFQFAAVAGAVTDYALFAYQVPAGFQLVIPHIRISCLTTGAIGSAITPTVMEWGLGINASAVSLATADGAGTWAPDRIPLGMQAWGLSAFIGSQPSDVISYPVDIVIQSGRFLHVIVQIPVGAATASQVFRGVVAFPGAYFE